MKVLPKEKGSAVLIGEHGMGRDSAMNKVHWYTMCYFLHTSCTEELVCC